MNSANNNDLRIRVNLHDEFSVCEAVRARLELIPRHEPRQETRPMSNSKDLPDWVEYAIDLATWVCLGIALVFAWVWIYYGAAV